MACKNHYTSESAGPQGRSLTPPPPSHLDNIVFVCLFVLAASLVE